MDKKTKIKTLKRMAYEIGNESTLWNGFNEFDQTQTEFTLSDEFLSEVSHKGLDMFIDLIEYASKSGINRKRPLTNEEMENNLKEKKF